jgi:recombination protein RecR
LELPEKINNSVDAFSRIQGVGAKTALRQVLSMCKWNKAELETFSSAIFELSKLNTCTTCGFYTDTDMCSVCLDEKRTAFGTICVVESIIDCLAIERSGNFHGTYHVLGGVLNPLMGIGPDELGIDILLDRINENVKGLILAVNPSVEGDATCSFIRDKLPERVLVDRIGFGIPMGGSLEYLDAQTITKALENRKKM